MSLSTLLQFLAKHRGQLLDVLVFVASVFLLAPFTDLLARLGAGFASDNESAARRLSWVVLIAFCTYTVGAILKRAPLHARIGALPNPGYAGCLFLIWISLHLALSIMGGAIVAVGFDAAPKGIPVALMILLILVPTIFATRVVFRPKKLAQITEWRKAWPMEVIADLLIASAVIMLTIMWNIWIADLFIFDSPGLNFSHRLFAAALAAGAFAMFYVAPRFLFLIEDFNRWVTWATIGLTLAPVVGRILLA